MDLKHQHRSAAATTSTAAFTATPGKRTLTEGLNASPAAATSYSPARSGIIQRQGGDKVPAPQLPKGPDSDAGRGATIATLLSSFQHVHVGAPVPDAASGDQAPARGWARGKSPSVQVDVSIPYWNNKYVQPVGGKSLDPPDGFDKTKTARNIAIYTLGIGAHDAVVTGKGYPDEIGALVTRAITLGLIDEPPAQPGADPSYWATAWRPVLEAWLIKVGIGIDCNGFVYEALNAVKDANGAATTGHGIIDNYPHEDVSRTTASIPELLKTGDRVNAPDDLQVADVMITEDLDHCRIVIAVDRSKSGQGITDFTTAESTAAPQAAGSSVNGPRIHYWRFTGTTLTQGWGPDDRSLADNDPTDKTTGRQAEFTRHLARPGTAQRKAAGEPKPTAAPRPGGAGAPLPPATRRKMERSFLTGFDRVRVHEGDDAPAIGAHAYADGEDLHFAPGRYRPGSAAGDALIGHELAHVVQQRDGRVAAPQGKGAQVVDDPALEAEADRMGEAAAEGRPAHPGADTAAHATATAIPGRTVQRQGGTGGGTATPSVIAFDPALQKLDALFDRRAAGQPVSDDEIHRAVAELVQCCRTTLPDPNHMQLYLDSSASDKTSVIGQMGDELARMEFMLGGLYNGAPSGVSWRADPHSAGLFTGAYLTAAGFSLPKPGQLEQTDTGEDWCTSFAGFGFNRLGADTVIAHSMGSGRKQHDSGNIVFPQDSWEVLRKLIAYRESSGQQGKVSVAALVDQFLTDPVRAIGVLSPSVPAKPDRSAFEQWLYNTGFGALGEMVGSNKIPVSSPVVGDLLILNPGARAVGEGWEHTAMIDRFSGGVLTTLEGNLADRTGSRRLDLHVPGDLDQVYFVTRPAAQIAKLHPGAAGSGAPGSDRNAALGAQELASLRADNAKLRAVFDRLPGTPSPHQQAPTPGA